jgi:arylsulfatase A-like enzyme
MEELRQSVEQIWNDPAARAALVDLYDSEIGYTDHHVEALLDMLPLEEDTLIVVTSDHGEEFLEHGGIEHGITLFEEVVRVPLILSLPGRIPAGTRVTQPVTNRDILPTILELLGIAPRSGRGFGSLLPLVAGEPDAEEPPVYTELDRGRDWKSIRRGPWKLVCRDQEDPPCFLFDLTSDPGEQWNLIQARGDVARSLSAELHRWMAAHPIFRPRTVDLVLDEEEEERLRSLGYLN